MTTQFETDCALMAGQVYLSTRTNINKLPVPNGCGWCGLLHSDTNQLQASLLPCKIKSSLS